MQLNLKTKLLLQFVLIGITPLAIMGILAYRLASSSLEEGAYNRLSVSQKVKQNEVERYFQTIDNQIITFAHSKMVVDAALSFKTQIKSFVDDNGLDSDKLSDMKNDLKSYYVGDFATEFRNQNGFDFDIEAKLNQLDDIGIALQHYYIKANRHPLGSKHLLNDAGDLSSYSVNHRVVHPIIREYLEKFGYYDIFIADIDTGHIIYSVFKELDFATSLINGPYSKTNFAEAFQKAAKINSKNASVLVDYKQYAPSFMAPASFIAAPIFHEDQKIAVAIFQMPIDRLNTIMADRTGMGETGETILVGADGLLRSDSRLDSENRNVVNSYKNPEETSIDSPEVELALRGESGQQISTNYLGTKVLSSYSPVDIVGLRWAFLAQMGTEEAFKDARKMAIYITIIGLISIVFTVLFGLYVGRNIANPILNVSSKLSENSLQVAGAASKLSASSQKMSELAIVQASSIEETAASIEEISAMVKNNVEQAEMSSDLSKHVKKVADEGNDSMSNLIKSMEEITNSNKNIQDLVKVIGEIGEKTEIIDEIVFQTKLLSFNASVEAERAGEHGRGFAVVAQEIGNLAQMSGNAALEIADMVRDSIKNAEKITNENKEKVESGNMLVQDTAKHLKDIESDAQKLTQQSEKIVKASKEQADGVSQVNEAISQLDQTTQQNASTAEGIASSSEQLEGQANYLNNNVKHLLDLVKEDETEQEQNSDDDYDAHFIDTDIKTIHDEAAVVPDTTTKIAVGQSHFMPNQQDDDWDKI